jgi:hypothetical protein
VAGVGVPELASGVIVAGEEASVGEVPLLKKISTVNVITNGVLACLEAFKENGLTSSLGKAEGAPEAGAPVVPVVVGIEGFGVVLAKAEGGGTFLNNKTLGASGSTLSSTPLIPTNGE